MRELCSGSEDAAWRIVDEYTPHVLRVIRASLPREIRSKVDSVDLANTMLGSLLLKRSQLSRIRAPEQLVALLTTAAQARVVEEHRKYTVYAVRSIRREEGSFDETSDSNGGDTGVAGDGRFGGREQTPSQVAISRESRAKWDRILESLSRRDRQVVALRVQGRTYDEIAQQVDDVSPRTARRVVKATIDKLIE